MSRLFTVLLASAIVLVSSDEALPKCSDADNCFGCFVQQECVPNPVGGEPLCTPCGWCTSASDDDADGNWWDADVHGKCVMAPLGAIDFCKFSDSPTSKRYCPDTVCNAGQAGCACEDNVCPAVEKIVGLLSMEALWALLLLSTLTFSMLIAVCVYLTCCRAQPPRQILVVQGIPVDPAQPAAAPMHPYSRMG